MKTIKLIDLLKEIEQGGSLPKLLIYRGEKYSLVGRGYDDLKFDYIDNDGRYLLAEIINSYYLTEVVGVVLEIIEEELEIEPFTEEELEVYHDMSAPIDDLAHKVGLLIEAVNKMGKKK